jgi:hypothetical protein
MRPKAETATERFKDGKEPFLSQDEIDALLCLGSVKLDLTEEDCMEDDMEETELDMLRRHLAEEHNEACNNLLLPNEMTLRDWFAGMAMVSFINDPRYTTCSEQEVATAAYRQADAMMEARKK